MVLKTVQALLILSVSDCFSQQLGMLLEAGLNSGVLPAKRFGCLIQYSFPTGVFFTESASGHTSYDWHAYVRNDVAVSLMYNLRLMSK